VVVRELPLMMQVGKNTDSIQVGKILFENECTRIGENKGVGYLPTYVTSMTKRCGCWMKNKSFRCMNKGFQLPIIRSVCSRPP